MIERRTLTDQVYQHLLREVLSGRLPAGHELHEAALAMKLSVPRPAVREAVWRLTAQSVVEPRGRGVVVRPFGPAQVRQVYQVREALESMAAELACGRLTGEDFDRLERLIADVPPREAPHHQEACHRLDLELHALIAARCGNPLLRREIDRLADLVQIVMFRVGSGHGALESALRAHLRIIQALQEGNASAARQRMAEHVRESGEAAAKFALGEDATDERAAELEPVQ
ncbi:MAG TPA: GntR family transcriptional regulator [Humisphaera sp.]